MQLARQYQAPMRVLTLADVCASASTDDAPGDVGGSFSARWLPIDMDCTGDSDDAHSECEV
eukprot:m.869182 g.869182  ORF g.869182 m.869182 type:complete len:61 (+) comp23563_c2_seq62:166-348(+)